MDSAAPDRTPLAGIEILDLGTLTPGKYCTFLLAELGASVLRVERPRDRSARVSDEDLVLNRGKRSLTLDLRNAAGREILDRLIDRADVVIESHRPAVAERLGLDYPRLARRNPRLVHCALSGFGSDGPYAERPGYDLIFLALSGALHAVFGAGVAPRPLGVYLADSVSGLMAAFAIAVALLARERDGAGRSLDLAMFDSIFSLLSTSHGLRRGDAADGAWSSPLYDVYATRDGRRVALAALRPVSCTALFEALGRAELAKRAISPDAGEEVRRFLEAAFATATAAEWCERLGALDVEIAEVRTPDEAFDDVQLAFRHMVLDVDHPQAGPLRQIGNPLCAGPAYEAPRPAPAIGADSDPVLRDLGLSAAEIARLRDDGVV